MPAWWYLHWQRWIQKRLKWQRCVELTQRNIYIFPTWFGGFFLAVTALLFLVALNYQNNSVYAFCFFLIAVFVSTIFSTFNNLKGMKICAPERLVAIADQPSPIPLQMSSGNRQRFGMEVGDEQGDGIALAENITLKFPVMQMWQTPGVTSLHPFRIKTVYPLGLFRAWTWVGVTGTCFVAPKPLRISDNIVANDTDAENTRGQTSANDEAHLREFRVGDGVKDIYWRKIASGGPWLCKYLQGDGSAPLEERLLDYNMSLGRNHLEKLSDLCFWLLQAQDEKVAVGLKLPDQLIAVAPSDQLHVERCLMALAEAV